jgi:hypothetical protein
MKANLLDAKSALVDELSALHAAAPTSNDTLAAYLQPSQSCEKFLRLGDCSYKAIDLIECIVEAK